MEAIEMLKERRSIRGYKDEKVSHELIKEIIEIARFSPSWKNFQIARYTAIDDEETIKKIAENGVKGFAHNMKTLSKAKGVMVLSFVKGKSGKLEPNGDFATQHGESWEVFDTGIACQTFCLAAHAKGVGTCIFGVIDHDEIAKIAKIPQEETVACVIAYGLIPDKKFSPTPRLDVDEILRFV